MADPTYQMDPEERREWIEAFDEVAHAGGAEAAQALVATLEARALAHGARAVIAPTTSYVNTIPLDRQPPYPGDRELERRIKSIIRWNAMAMVVRANRVSAGIGGHISTYASAATLYEVGFNHFFRGAGDGAAGDFLYIQGHASPGIYSRAFLEGRLPIERLENFRRELNPGGGLSSYPHPWLMPDFWQFPTVSMGLGPITAIYHARFNRYLHDRGLVDTSGTRVWAFLGDGETDEPESLGALTLAARERLDNLVFVVNCNLQRLDGPVRGNGKIVQELEAAFRGAGWNVLKVLWGGNWDPLFDRDHDGQLARRLDEIVDGQYQKYVVSSGAYVREHLFENSPDLQERYAWLSDQELRRLNRGGHDPAKVFAAYQAAVGHRGAPTVILAKTVKGYGLGEAGEGRNVTHQQKKLNEDELREFRARFGIPIADHDVARAPFYLPPPESPEMKYLHERRAALGGFLPARRTVRIPFEPPAADLFAEFAAGTDGREVSTTMAFVRILTKLLKDPKVGRFIVPIVPDEARTFGMEALFRQNGIYSSVGQNYEPVDSDSLLYYKEAKDGQILEEGITEAGSFSSFVAAGTAYANHGVKMIPFYIYYSMFGFQRIGDLAWLAGDSRCRGFLLGATAGRTTLAGEGLQHQDGHSHILSMTVPNCRSWDPAFAFEIAVIIREGMRRMFEEDRDEYYYLTLTNENYAQPPMPEGAEEGILRGLYRFQAVAGAAAARILASGPMVNEATRAATILRERYAIPVEVWSVTSWQELRRDALACERRSLLGLGEPEERPYIARALAADLPVTVAVSDYMKLLPDALARWIPGRLLTLGTDGFGRSESREALRDYFEVDSRYIALAVLQGLARAGRVEASVAHAALIDLGINLDKPEPAGA